MPGPAPKDPSQRRRRNATPGFRLLPHEGRKGDPPDWPLASFPTHDETRIWKRLWALPQAVEWERMRCEDIVALYVRAFCLASKEDDVKLYAEVRQLDAKIGLSPKAMQDLRWETDEAREEEDDSSDKPDRQTRVYVPPTTTEAAIVPPST